MMIDPSLPNDLETCQRELLAARREVAHLEQVVTETAAACEAQQIELEKLKGELDLFKRFVFGRRSERYAECPGQGHLFDLSGDEGEPPCADHEAAEEEITYRRRRRGHGWSRLPDHLPREEVLVDVPESERICSCCQQPLERIGEDRTNRVDYRPAQVVVKIIIRPKYACRHKHAGVMQSPLPPSPVPGGRFDFGFVAQVVASKIADHLPLYRQQDQFARAGLELNRSTLCEIMAGAAELLEPLAMLLGQRVRASGLLGADDTPVRLLDPEHPAGARTARFWLYRGMNEAPYNVFDFHPSRERDGPRSFLADFRGWVKVDAYGVQGGVYLNSGDRIRASCCMAHARRKFHDALSSHPVLAAEALALFQQLYDIEDRARDSAAEARQELRAREAAPLLQRLKCWLDEHADSALPKLKLGEAIGYARNQWTALTSYLADGRLPIDNNDTERDLRRIAIGRKNWLFIGSPEAGPRAAILYTVVASAARHDLDIWAYLRDALERLARGDADLASLLPDAWAQTHPQSIRTYRQREREAKAAAKRQRRHRRRLLDRARTSKRR